jgi:hypothetical protein
MSPGTPKAIWERKKVEACSFATKINMTIPDFNDCFILRVGGVLKHNHKDKLDKDSPLTQILKDHKR